MTTAIVDGIEIFHKAIEGNPCPKCCKTSSTISTTNEWKYHCMSCDIRFNDNGEVLYTGRWSSSRTY